MVGRVVGIVRVNEIKISVRVVDIKRVDRVDRVVRVVRVVRVTRTIGISGSYELLGL